MVFPHIPGHSGCKVELTYRDGLPYVRKSSEDQAVAGRLIRQALKQQQLRASGSIAGIYIPEVIEFCDDGFLMEFVPGQDMPSHLASSSLREVHRVRDVVEEFIDERSRGCQVRTVSAEVFRSKTIATLANIEKNPDIAAEVKEFCREIVEQLEWRDRDLLTGSCHGDLTLSNMLYSQGRVVLLDFLDSFVEAPLMDIVKLRQDTFHGWSLLMVRSSSAHAQLKSVLAGWDESLKGRDDTELSILNLLRVLQYAHDRDVIAHLQNELRALCT